MAFFGRRTVLADLRLHKMQAGLVGAATLSRLDLPPIAYGNVCLWPTTESSALDTDEGLPSDDGKVTAWRTSVSEAAPRPDDSWTINGVDYLITEVAKRHNHDEAAGFCIYDCAIGRPGPR
jgi:hypothetical protein